MFKIRILGYEISISKVNELQKIASAAKSNTVLKKIEDALIFMNKNKIKYTEYALQRNSNVSINTIKKYRLEIDKIRMKISS